MWRFSGANLYLVDGFTSPVLGSAAPSSGMGLKIVLILENTFCYPGFHADIRVASETHSQFSFPFSLVTEFLGLGTAKKLWHTLHIPKRWETDF